MDEPQPSPPPLPPLGKRVLINLFWLGLVGLSFAYLLSLFATRWWFADLFTHFRVQGFLLSIVLLIVGISLGYWRSTLITIPLLIVHASMLAPYFPINQQQVPVEVTQKLLVWNVYVGNRQHEEIISVIRRQQADLVLLLEVSPQLGMVLGELKDLYSEIEIQPSTDAFGIAVLSRQPQEMMTIRPIGDDLTNSVIVQCEDGVTFIGAHTLPPAGSWYSRTRNQQLNGLAEFCNSLQGPIIMAGDLNVTPWSPHFQNLVDSTALRDHRRGRGILASWPSNRPLIRIPIDHVLSTEQVTVHEYQVLSDSHGSDHYPLTFQWSLR